MVSKIALELDIKKLSSLHTLIADTLIDLLKGGQRENWKMIEAAIKFLHNNGINASPLPNEKPEDTAKRVADILTKSLPKDEDFADTSPLLRVM